MDYEKKYNEALERARKIHNDTEFDYEKGMMEEVFPELKESNDEKIKKAIICGMNALKEQHKETFASIPINDCIAWLEKQVSPQMVIDAYLRGCNDTEKKWLKKQEEQKQQCKSTTISSSDITTITTVANENECFTH